MKRGWIIHVLAFALPPSQGFAVFPSRPFNNPPIYLSTVSSEIETHINQGKDATIGLYVHIPYCRRRCRYCNFSIVPIGTKVQTETETKNSDVDSNTQGFLDMDESYRQTLLKEIDRIRNTATKTPIILKSIYFGGGTPSLAPLKTIQAILDALLKDDHNPLFILTTNAEVSIEMDPGTFSKNKLQALKEMGFNRISLGVQSFDDAVLVSIGRQHRRDDVFRSIETIHAVFGTDVNYSIDLISGLPGLSLALWAETLATAVALQPSHLSLYDLQVEQGTVFGKWYGAEEGVSQQTRGRSPVGALLLPSEEDCAFMYKYAAGYLRAKGYEHYEVSSYAYVGPDSGKSNRSQHNQIYWAVDGQWFALGLGSTSFVEGKTVARPKTLVDYREWVETTTKSLPEEGNNPVDRMDFLTDVVMKRLRTADGLDLNWIQEHYGQKRVDAVMKGAALGLELDMMKVEKVADPPARQLRLVDPVGFLYSNNLISSIFLELEEAEEREG